MWYCYLLFVLMIRLPPRSTRTYTLLPDPTLFRSRHRSPAAARRAQGALRRRRLVRRLVPRPFAECRAGRPGPRRGDRRRMGGVRAGVPRRDGRPLPAPHARPARGAVARSRLLDRLLLRGRLQLPPLAASPAARPPGGSRRLAGRA